MQLRKHMLLVLGLASQTLAGVAFTSPTADTVIPGASFTVTWQDNGSPPSISDLTTYTLELWTGSNSAPAMVTAFPVSGTVGKGSVAVTITNLNLGASSPANAYFLKMTSTEASGGLVINYSGRFTLAAMTGVFGPDIAAALGAGTGNTGPVDPPVGAAAPAPAATNPGGDQFAIPYIQQTGNVRYAPMQPLPPNSITAQNTSPLWPTSSVVVATTFLPIPTVTTTYTQAATWAFTSHPNTAAAQSQPTDDMQKFLNRWKD